MCLYVSLCVSMWVWMRLTVPAEVGLNLMRILIQFISFFLGGPVWGKFVSIFVFRLLLPIFPCFSPAVARSLDSSPTRLHLHFFLPCVVYSPQRAKFWLSGPTTDQHSQRRPRGKYLFSPPLSTAAPCPNNLQTLHWSVWSEWFWQVLFYVFEM